MDQVQTWLEYQGSIKEYKIPLFKWFEIPIGVEIKGPCIILNNTSTVIVEHDCIAVLTSQ